MYSLRILMTTNISCMWFPRDVHQTTRFGYPASPFQVPPAGCPRLTCPTAGRRPTPGTAAWRARRDICGCSTWMKTRRSTTMCRRRSLTWCGASCDASPPTTRRPCPSASRPETRWQTPTCMAECGRVGRTTNDRYPTAGTLLDTMGIFLL